MRAGAAALDDPGDAGRAWPACWCCSGSCSPTSAPTGSPSPSTSSALILAILLISQFWTLANDVYDPRQAKRIFGFIGGGASLGGAMRRGLTAFLVESVGAKNMLLVSAGVMGVCLAIVMFDRAAREVGGHQRRDEDRRGRRRQRRRGDPAAAVVAPPADHRAGDRLCAPSAPAIIEQQLNMAAAESKGAGNADAIAAFLGAADRLPVADRLRHPGRR